MDSAVVSLQSVLVLLASSVLAVALCRSLQLPPMIGYLVSGLALGPHALGLVSDIAETRPLPQARACRRGCPDFLDRARIQLAEAPRHASRGVRARPDPGGRDDRAGARRRACRRRLVAGGAHPRRHR